MSRFLLTFLCACPTMWAADTCQPNPEVRDALFEYRENWRAPLAGRMKTIDGLAQRYPASYDVQLERISFYRWNAPERFSAVRAAYVKTAETRPDDPVALAVAAAALTRVDTPKAITLLEKARELAPGNGGPALQLAGVYQEGKFQDKTKAAEMFAAYVRACPGRLNRQAEWVMGKVAPPEAQAAVARALRQRLEKETDPKELHAFTTLWGLEFRTRPPQEHRALREQVARDLERLSTINEQPDARWLDMLVSGSKQSGAPEVKLEAMRDRLLKEAPRSSQAYSIAYERWKKTHPEPEDHKDADAWQRWKKAHLAMLKVWAEQFTEAEWLKDSLLALRIELKEIGEKEAIAALEESLRTNLERSGPHAWGFLNPAGTLLRERWAPAKAVSWMEKAWPLAASDLDRQLEDDTLTTERREQLLEARSSVGFPTLVYLEALELAGKNVPAPLRSFVEGPVPAKKSAESGYWWARARLATIDGRTADALAYYQAALFSREKTPQHFRGMLRDDLLGSARQVFLKNGGSEAAFAMWSRQRDAKPVQLADGRWEKPKKVLPPFELADLSGRTWKLKQLEGKALLINLWATWCGPCRSELPQFQKLYEQTRERSDVQVLTFNIDEELGLVEPFMKEQKFTFPVLSAYGFVRQLLDGIGIPQNWLVGPNGEWLATQIGFDASDADWVNTMLRKLEAAREGKGPAD